MVKTTDAPTISTNFLMIGLLLLGMGSLSAANPGDWPFAIDFSQLPEKDLPAWTRGGQGEAEVKEGKLHLRSSLEEGIAYSLAGEAGSAIWDGTLPSTVRFRVRIVDSLAGDTAAHVAIRAENRYFLIPISNREEETYQFLFTEEGNGRLFIDGQEQTGIKAHPMPDKKNTNLIMFGDLGGSTGGETEWSEFQWTNEGAFEP